MGSSVVPVLIFLRTREIRPVFFALRVPKAAYQKAVAAVQHVSVFSNTTLANPEGVQRINEIRMKQRVFTKSRG